MAAAIAAENDDESSG